MQRHVTSILMFLGTLLSAQNILTITGIPYSHRDDVDGQPALSAPLGPTEGEAKYVRKP